MDRKEIKQLNDDIKSFYDDCEYHVNNDEPDDFIDWLESSAKNRFLKLYLKDDLFLYISRESILILLKLNLKYRFLSLHNFGNRIDLKRIIQ